MKRPLKNRLLAALKPVRGPVRAVDLTHDAQFPFDFTGEPVSADAQLQQRLLEPELEQFEQRYPGDSPEVTMRADRPEEPSPEQERPRGVWAPPIGEEDPPTGEAAATSSAEMELETQDATLSD